VVICETDKKDGLGAGGLFQIKPSRQLARALPLSESSVTHCSEPDLDLDQLYRETSLSMWHECKAPRAEVALHLPFSGAADGARAYRHR
jgi:hypothetical protein